MGDPLPIGAPAPARLRLTPPPAPVPARVRLSSDELRTEQERTLAAPRRRYGPLARVLFSAMDQLYGPERTLSKFKVLEVIARVPYQAWERIGYLAITHRYSRPSFARRIFERVEESRLQQDNEQWHLLILEELVWATGRRENFFRFRVIPQAIALTYHAVSGVLYVLHPASSYSLNADFEDHAEHEYALFAAENPSLAGMPYDGMFAEDYGRFDSLADLFRQIGFDERMHKEESLARRSEARFR